MARDPKTNMSDVELPSVSFREERTARKVHKCCECGHDIEPGEKYNRYSGVWDGAFNVYKFCGDCHRVAEWCSLFLEDWCPIFGDMYSELTEYAVSINFLATTIPHRAKVIYRIT